MSQDTSTHDERMTKGDALHRIVIVGGGAAGLNLATRLSRKNRGDRRFKLTLIDENLTHIWKPTLHEFAAGSKGAGYDEISFLSHSVEHGYDFQLGRFAGVSLRDKHVYLDPADDPAGEAISPARAWSYDTLVLAIGSVASTFEIPGVKEHCLFLDTPRQAKKLQRHLLNICLRHESGAARNRVDIAIVGGGATGVELAAEISEAISTLAKNGLSSLSRADAVNVWLLEAGDRLLPVMAEKISDKVKERLSDIGVSIRTNAIVERVEADRLILKGGDEIRAGLKIWAAGVSAPGALKDLADFEHDKIGRIKVRKTLQTTTDDSVFVIGDSAHCPCGKDGASVPPRAQAASQQAEFMAEQTSLHAEGRPLEDFVYRDKGSLVSLSDAYAAGSIMGKSLGAFTLEGRKARLAYLLLYRMHLQSVLGLKRAIIQTALKFLASLMGPRQKLY